MSDFPSAMLESLLNRPLRRVLSDVDRRAFAHRRVLVTGAGGSIGSELARQIAACGAAEIVLVDQSEYNLFRIERELADRFPLVSLEPLLGDVTRGGMLQRACRASRPHVVYHAAAYKHVTMTERAVCAATQVNVLGSALAVAAAKDVGARFVLISSDKAASPTSVMGVTKRIAELVVSREASSRFRPIVVRFGNVLGSSGSVLPLLVERIRSGRPIEITDPDATRYFMTAAEAVALVMKADLVGPPGEIYWLDMGDPIRIGDLAERVLDFEERAGYPRVPVRIIGLRPGEKLHEQLDDQTSGMVRTNFARLWASRGDAVHARVIGDVVRRLRRRIVAGDPIGALQDFGQVVPEFRASRDAWAAANAQAAGEYEIDLPSEACSA